MIKNKFAFRTLPSTSDWAVEHLNEFSKFELTIITAEEQTAGHGQFGRPWHSPGGVNLYLTYVFFQPEGADPIRITHLLGLTVAKLFPSLPCRIKWPNDILCNDKKLGGILCVTREDAVILSIGLNANLQDTSPIDQPATSLLLETGKRHSLKQLSENLTEAFASNLAIYKQSGFTPFLEAFSKVEVPSCRGQHARNGVPSKQ